MSHYSKVPVFLKTLTKMMGHLLCRRFTLFGASGYANLRAHGGCSLWLLQSQGLATRRRCATYCGRFSSCLEELIYVVGHLSLLPCGNVFGHVHALAHPVCVISQGVKHIERQQRNNVATHLRRLVAAAVCASVTLRGQGWDARMNCLHACLHTAQVSGPRQ